MENQLGGSPMSTTTHLSREDAEQPASTEALVGPDFETYDFQSVVVLVPSEKEAMRAPSPSCGLEVSVYSYPDAVAKSWHMMAYTFGYVPSHSNDTFTPL
eukprot:CAMPEP_0114135228 /NCGR_PEP_ID=MMETSP0043_2-20121206/14590_1 /TAXON_ID=464988 /ORGANISM="Hemiselmis andersenii, Strain CCMP644" /LENGTH=99 /DNA_ID=CAMNT_0001228943 /DNA_START=580 /DNA_END=879 /DNA_ORIENTATION=+